MMSPVVEGFLSIRLRGRAEYYGEPTPRI